MNTEVTEQLVARLAIYRYLAWCFSYPGEDLLRLLKAEDWREIASYFGCVGIEAEKSMGRIQDWLQRRSSDQTALTELEVEYTRLFINGYPTVVAPPYGSIYLERDDAVWGQSTAEVARMYAEVGLSISADFHNLPDHIAAELEFASYLIGQSLKAREGNGEQGEQISTLSSLQKRFMTQLVQWTPDFFDRVIESAEAAFYRESAVLAKAFIDAEASAWRRFPMKIEVLGPGCERCHATEENVKLAVKELGIEAEVVKVEDMGAILEKGVWMTPGVIIDGEKVSEGRVPRPGEIRAWLEARSK